MRRILDVAAMQQAMDSQTLIRLVRSSPWTSAQDALLISTAMTVAVLLALEYDVVVFWDELGSNQRRLRVEEILALTMFLGLGIYGFVVRRIHEERRGIERRLSAEVEARENRVLAMQDPLTGLPNRRALTKAIETAFAASKSARLVHAFFLLDLNGFKRVNDDHGHLVGDEVLRVVAERFVAVSRRSDMIARLGGDEFAVLSCNLESRDQAEEIGRRFIAALGSEVRVDNTSYQIGVSVGVALFPQDGASAEEIMRRADLAMYQAKANKTSSLRFCESREETPAMLEQARA
jgi:diguanylate cyclase (GGDEF)-like protein